MKKLFIISSILLVIVLVFLGVYNFAFKKSQPLVVQKTAVEQPVENKMPAKTEKITAISSSSVIGAVMDKKTDEIKYYDANNGTAWQFDADGKNKQQISDTKITGLKSVLWSADLGKVLTVAQKNGQSTFYEYDYNSKKATALKNGLDTAVWDNLGTKIYYKYYDSKAKTRTLNIANPDGSGWQKVADIESRIISVAPVPLSSFVSFWNFPSANEETKLQTVGATGGEVKTIFSGRYGADYLWSPNGAKALVSSLANKDNKTITLGTVMVDGKYQDLNIPTIVSKCVWSQDNKTIYYALPGGIPSDAVMPDDYQANKFTTSDTFWKMDTSTGEKSRVVEATEISGTYDSSSMFLSSTEDALYFVNKIDQKLYRVEL